MGWLLIVGFLYCGVAAFYTNNENAHGFGILWLVVFAAGWFGYKVYAEPLTAVDGFLAVLITAAIVISAGLITYWRKKDQPKRRTFRRRKRTLTDDFLDGV